MWTLEQQKAINLKGTNILVSAGAGSGKTAVLVERIFTFVKEGASVLDFLVLTFTNAAALEMRDRLFKKLVSEGFLDEARKLFIAHITTFDAFSLYLCKKYRNLLNLKKDVKVCDEFLIYNAKKNYLRELFDSYYDSLDNDFFNFLDFFCLKNDDDLIKCFLELSDSIDLNLEKENYLDNYFSNFYSDEFINKVKDLYHNSFKLVVDDCIYNLNLCSYGVLNHEDLYNYLLNAFKTYDVINIKSALEQCSSFNKKCISKECHDYFDYYKKSLEDLEIYLNKDIDEEILIYKNNKCYIEFIIKVLKLLDEFSCNYKYSNEYFTFLDIELLAISLIKKHKNVLDELRSFKQVMVDEFQDTSDIQDVFLNLVENNNLYLVGDIKQSIYRFRNANPNIFMRYFNKYKNNDGGVLLTLSSNFRSRSEVLEDINSMFSSIMTSDLGDASFKLEHVMEFGLKDFDNFNSNLNYHYEDLRYLIEEDYKYYSNAVIEAFIIASKIKELFSKENIVYDKGKLRNARFSDFAIIIDRKDSFTLFKKVFEYLDLPLSIEADIDLKHSRLALTLLNLLRVIKCLILNNRDDKFAFVSLSRSFLVCMCDSDIYNTLNNNLSFYFEEDINQIILENNYNLLAIFNSVLDYLDIYNKLVTIGNVSNSLLELAWFKEKINSYLDLNFSSTEVIDLISDLFSSDIKLEYKMNESSSDQIKIMTVHHSKGLEFPFCFFPCLNKHFSLRDLKKRFFYTKNYGIYLNSKSDEKSFLYPLISRDFITEERSEKMRLFYVALTRTKEKFYLVSENKSTKDLNCFLAFLNLYIPNYSILDLASYNLTNDYYFNSSRTFKSGSKVLSYNELDSISEVRKGSISKKITSIISDDERYILKRGEYLHKVLEFIDFKSRNYNDFNVNLCDQDIINKVLDLDLFKSILDFKLYREHEFYFVLDGVSYSGIIDLLSVKDDSIYIIDYKLSNLDPLMYKKQLDVYYDYVFNSFNIKPRVFLVSLLNASYLEVFYD